MVGSDEVESDAVTCPESSRGSLISRRCIGERAQGGRPSPCTRRAARAAATSEGKTGNCELRAAVGGLLAGTSDAFGGMGMYAVSIEEESTVGSIKIPASGVFWEAI